MWLNVANKSVTARHKANLLYWSFHTEMRQLLAGWKKSQIMTFFYFYILKLAIVNTV